MKIAVLGSTGSIGVQTLDVVRECLPHARITALSGFSNIETLARQVNEFKPLACWVRDEQAAKDLAGKINVRCEILIGEAGLISCASETNADIVVNALVGRAGLKPTLAAINAGKHIALSNKETLVTAGELVTNLAREKNVRLTPIDSEHSAIWQCLDNNTPEKIILTASGGPFRGLPREKIAAATAKDALKHPNWSMGDKITIDSATLMNKGLELIEAMWLFDQPQEKIDVVVHPQSIIHSMVQYEDGSILAQMGLADMRLPILYALSSPERVKNNFARLDLLTCGDLTFEPPNTDNFPCLALARHAAQQGGTLPAVMNYINEWAVYEFLSGRISFYGISDIIEQAFGIYTIKEVKTLDDVNEAESWAGEFIRERGTP
ncbi:MAG: 1-deoxy-D-xylulose-5-phosphate reductoisomerase [Defluviitaleaceae bacterium]|nr:1-deoxy-D-xylulose-5-phosphate reductoisomerase [Defluviitaleaceae bacterium]